MIGTRRWVALPVALAALLGAAATPHGGDRLRPM